MSKLAKRDIVKAKEGHHLVCGCGEYVDALVISVEPLILVSRETDMRWSCFPKENLEVVGKAGWLQYFKCLRRRKK